MDTLQYWSLINNFYKDIFFIYLRAFWISYIPVALKRENEWTRDEKNIFNKGLNGRKSLGTTGQKALEIDSVSQSGKFNKWESFKEFFRNFFQHSLSEIYQKGNIFHASLWKASWSLSKLLIVYCFWHCKANFCFFFGYHFDFFFVVLKETVFIIDFVTLCLQKNSFIKKQLFSPYVYDKDIFPETLNRGKLLVKYSV